MRGRPTGFRGGCGRLRRDGGRVTIRPYVHRVGGQTGAADANSGAAASGARGVSGWGAAAGCSAMGAVGSSKPKMRVAPSSSSGSGLGSQCGSRRRPGILVQTRWQPAVFPSGCSRLRRDGASRPTVTGVGSTSGTAGVSVFRARWHGTLAAHWPRRAGRAPAHRRPGRISHWHRQSALPQFPQNITVSPFINTIFRAHICRVGVPRRLRNRPQVRPYGFSKQNARCPAPRQDRCPAWQAIFPAGCRSTDAFPGCPGI